LPSHPSTSNEETLMYSLVVLLRVLCVRAMHDELYIRAIQFGALLEFNVLEFDILEIGALSSTLEFCSLQLYALSFASNL
jgi:hypothetical protein